MIFEPFTFYSIAPFILIFSIFSLPFVFVLALVWLTGRGKRNRAKNDIPATALEELKKRADHYKERIEVLESLLLEQEKKHKESR